MESRIICNASDISLMLDRLCAQIMENYPKDQDLLIIGIERRGKNLASRIVERLEKMGKHPQEGSIDINFYRDDWTTLAGEMPVIGKSHMPCLPDNRHILLVDDVLFSGRTIRAALEALMDYGRPRKIELLTLIDRGHRELPICPNYAGKIVPTRRSEHIDVMLTERDGEDAVILRR